MTEEIVGKIRRIKYHNISTGSRSGVPFLIAEIDGGRTVKGEMREPSYTETYRFIGEWKTQPKYGDAFEFFAWEEMVESSVSGVTQYLSRKIKGVGKAKIASLVEAFGVDTLRTLQAKPELSRQVKGITEADAEAIREYFEENRRVDPAAVAKILDMFGGHYLPKKLAEQLVVDFGSDAPGLLYENPYLVLAYPRTGWRSVDPFALGLGYDPEGVERHKAAIVEALEQHSGEGHTYAIRNEVDTIATRLLGRKPSEQAWVASLLDGTVVAHGLQDFDQDLEDRARVVLADMMATYSLPKLAQAEASIASRLASLASSAKPLEFEPDVEGLNDDQASAVRMFHESGVCLLLGAPGTGKTYTIGRFVRSLVQNGVNNIRCVAPTGKAAKRTEEMIAAALGSDHGIVSSTVHRALEPSPGDAPLGVPGDVAKIGRGREGFRFLRNESNPIDAQVLIVDETSMEDVPLGDLLVRAIANGTRVVFVGDINQLPSVGPGAFLRDIKESGAIPYVELTRIVRSDGGGRVVRACHAIKEGVVPEPADDLSLPLDNWVHIEADEPEAILETIVELHRSIKDNGNYDPYWDVQVVAAQIKKEGIGCNAINDRLSALLNGKPSPPPAEAAFRTPFRDGDKVVRTKNGLVSLMVRDDNKSFLSEKKVWYWKGERYTLRDVDVVNGDMGEVLDIVEDGKNRYVVVRFRTPDRLCRLPWGENHLEAAFAMTCHKAQGSGFKIVIVPVHLLYQWNPRTGTGLFSRELFYTEVSRAEILLFTVGQWAAVETVVSRVTVGFRRTLLRSRLKEAFTLMATGYERE